MQTIKVGIKFGLEQPVAGVGVEHRSEPLHLGSLVIRSVQISFPGAQFFCFWSAISLAISNILINFQYKEIYLAVNYCDFPEDF